MYGDFKCSEWRNTLLFYVTNVIGPLEPALQRVWLKFSFVFKACYVDEEEYAAITAQVNLPNLLDEFYSSYTTLFGELNCVYYAHQIGAHLLDSIRCNGPIHQTSAFPFEYAYATMRRRYKGTSNCIKQIMVNSFLHATNTHSHVCSKTIVYDTFYSNRSHNCFCYTHEDGSYQFWQIVHVGPTEHTFQAKKFPMVPYTNPNAVLPFDAVGVFQRRLPMTGLHTLTRQQIKGKLVLLEKLMISVPESILRET